METVFIWGVLVPVSVFSWLAVLIALCTMGVIILCSFLDLVDWCIGRRKEHRKY